MTSSSVPDHKWSQALQQTTHIPGSKTKITNVEESEVKSSLLSANQGSIFVSVFEAEKIVESLKVFTVDEIGSTPFLQMYACDVERLSLQAHASAKMNIEASGDEYIVEAIMTFSKIPVLVKTLLAVEAWRIYILRADRLAPLLAENKNSLRCAFSLHVETTIISLLNLIFYHRTACDEIDAEIAVSLVDYCARNMASLAVPTSENSMVRRQKEPLDASELSIHMHQRTTLDEIMENRMETEFKTAIAATVMARYLCEHFESLPLSAQSRILDTHDFLVMFVPLIDEPPWTRRRVSKIGTDSNKKMIWEKYVDNKWEVVEPAALLEITKCEAQCWIAIFHLTCSKTCRSQYGLNTFRKEQLLRLRKFLNEVMLDQLPILAEIMRYMDELCLMSVPESSTGQGSALLMQQVSLVRDAIIRGKEWSKVAKMQYEEIFSQVTDAKDVILRNIGEIYTMDSIDDIIGEHRFDDFELTSQSVDSMILTVFENNVANKTFEYILKPVGDSTSVETNNGPYQRTKLSISKVDEDHIVIHQNCRIEIAIKFEDDMPHTVLLKFEDIDLPCIENIDNIDSLPSVQWRQFGSIDEKIVVQIGFRKIEHGFIKYGSNYACYKIYTGFLSQPTNNTK